MIKRRLIALLPVATLLAACAISSLPPTSVADAIARNPDLSTFNGLLVTAGLSDTLKSGGPYTVLAPTNEAFKAVSAKTMDDLAANPARLKAVLSHHVVPGKIMATDVRNFRVDGVHGSKLELARSGAFVTVEDAMVQQSDIVAANGVVHTVDRVLTPVAAR
jgi:uncharacterized surface protein with fasciclin (FAS1) repeats